MEQNGAGRGSHYRWQTGKCKITTAGSEVDRMSDLQEMFIGGALHVIKFTQTVISVRSDLVRTLLSYYPIKKLFPMDACELPPPLLTHTQRDTYADKQTHIALHYHRAQTCVQTRMLQAVTSTLPCIYTSCRPTVLVHCTLYTVHCTVYSMWYGVDTVDKRWNQDTAVAGGTGVPLG